MDLIPPHPAVAVDVAAATFPWKDAVVVVAWTVEDAASWVVEEGSSVVVPLQLEDHGRRRHADRRDVHADQRAWP